MSKDWFSEIPAYGICADMAGGIGKYVLQQQEKERKKFEREEKATPPSYK